MPEALVFGASGQIGAALLPRLVAAGWSVRAVSRQPQAAASGVRWLRGDLGGVDGLPARVDAIVSCGPLDHFSHWYLRDAVEAPCVVAFGSTSATVKQASADATERDLAARLGASEARLLDHARTRGARATLLRPTLVYGSGRDRTLTRIALLARRLGMFALPADATGLRQPVHVEDLAQAASAALRRGAGGDRAYDLPGGETLAYREMVARTLAALPAPQPRLLLLPPVLFAPVAAAARATGRLQGFGAAALGRLRDDLVFDGGDAGRDLGYAPRPFAPTADMLLPR